MTTIAVKPEFMYQIIQAAVGPTPEQKRRVILGLAFVSMGCVIRRRLGLPRPTKEDGAELLRQIKEAFP